MQKNFLKKSTKTTKNVHLIQKTMKTKTMQKQLYRIQKSIQNTTTKTPPRQLWSKSRLAEQVFSWFIVTAHKKTPIKINVCL